MHGYFSPYRCPTLSDGPSGEYLTYRLTDEAIGLIESSGSAPFFLNSWPYAVHTPIEAPEPLVAKYREKARQMGLDKLRPFEDGEAFPFWQKRGQRVQRRRIQSDPTYAAMIENLDWNIGRLLETLERSGHADNTLVVFTSDNGGLATAETSPTSNAPLAEGKGWMYDGGVREPLLVGWPGVVEPGSRTAEPVTTPDFYPTLLEACGLALRPEQHRDGKSFLPILRGEPWTRGPIFWHYPHYSNQGGAPAAAVRDGTWKLVRFYDPPRQELYNLAEDISESNDLATKETNVARRLALQLDRWAESIGCVVPDENPYDPFEDVPG